MRLATFIPPGGEEPRAGEVRGEEMHAFASGTVLDRLASGDLTPADGRAYPLDAVTLLAPVPRPRAIFGIGRNYAAHAAELGNVLPKVPLVFMKLPTSSVPPSGPVRCPAVVEQLDYEAELAVVIGRRCRHVSREDAPGVVGGYTIANDVSVRDWQRKTQQWTLGKSFDTHGPLGPWIVTPDELGDPHAVSFRTHVSGELRQQSNTSNLIHDCWDLIADISTVCTLEPGDVIATGTCSGVAAFMTPPKWLTVGDVVRIEFDGIGAIENRVVAESNGA
jgi:2-keto-4-pentenoate hydratase/2-oxohepta-3-ene-1,7-dioic acid hydratase in catechol pathway